MKTRVSLETGAAANPFLQQVAVAVFEANGWSFLHYQPRLYEAFEALERLPCYPIVRRSLEMACVAYYAPVFEGRIRKDSTREQCWFEHRLLRYASGQVSEVIAEFMAENRAQCNPLTLRREIVQALNRESAGYRRRPGRPLKEYSLRTAILSLWLHGFLWIMSNPHRALFLEKFANDSFEGCYGEKAEAVKTMVRRLGLVGWSAFTAGGVPRPPAQLIQEANGRLSLKIDMDWLEQHLGCQKIKFPPGHNSIMSPYQECVRSA